MSDRGYYDAAEGTRMNRHAQLTTYASIPPTVVEVGGKTITATQVEWILCIPSAWESPDEALDLYLAETTAHGEESPWLVRSVERNRLFEDPAWPGNMPQPPEWFVKAARQMLKNLMTTDSQTRKEV